MRSNLLVGFRDDRRRRRRIFVAMTGALAVAAGLLAYDPQVSGMLLEVFGGEAFSFPRASPRDISHLRAAVAGSTDESSADLLISGAAVSPRGGSREPAPESPEDHDREHAASLDEPRGIAPRGIAPKGEPVVRSLRSLLGEVARDSGLALVVSSDVGGELAGVSSAPLPWERRLAAYSRVGRFDYRVSEGLIEVARSLDVEAAEPGDGQVDGGTDGVEDNAVDVAPSVVRTIRLRHARAADLVKTLDRLHKGNDLRVAANEASNTLLVRGDERAAAATVRLVTSLDVAPRRLLLETKIIEINRSASGELGIEWKIAGEIGANVDLPAADAAREAAGLVVATGIHPRIEARLGALEASGRVRVVSRPRIVMLEGTSAVIESVRVLRIRLPDRAAIVAEGDAGSTASRDRATEEVPVGIRLEVVPTVQEGRLVRLHVLAKSSSLGPPLPPDGIPEEQSRTVEADVLVADGETAVLGGLQREGSSRSGTGVPVLRDIPGLGLLFGKKSKEHDREELLVLVRPTLLDAPP